MMSFIDTLDFTYLALIAASLTALMTSGRRHFLDLPKLRLTILPEPVGYAEPGQSDTSAKCGPSK